MIDEDDHRACVDTWMERASKGLSPGQLFEIFEQGFDAVWRRAHRTLGDVTLMAIVDRVLYSAAATYPIFSTIEVQSTGIRWRELKEHARSMQADELAGAMRFVLVELLTVLGTLTAEILTPALHAELAKAAPERPLPGPASNGEAPNSESIDDGQGAKS